MVPYALTTYTLDTNGNVSGNTFSGCSLSGWYTIPDAQFNQLYTEIDVTGCSENPLIYGAGNVGKDDFLFFALTDNFNGKFWVLER